MRTALFLVAFCLLAHINSNQVKDIILSSMEKSPLKDQFKAYHFLFNKAYDLSSEEGLTRYKIFKKSLKLIKEVNAKGLGYTLGLNNFADMTQEEYLTYLSKPAPAPAAEKRFNNRADYVNNFTITDEQDSEEANPNWSQYLPNAQNEGSCHASYAFSTIAAIQANYYKSFSSSLDLSEQYAIDCISGNDCTTGSSATTIEFIKENGIPLEADYSYESGSSGKKGECKSSVKKVKVIESVEIGEGKHEFNRLIKKGVVKVSIDAKSETFKLYKGGRVKLTECTEESHELIAYGTAKDGDQEVILLRNNFGSDWGDNGNITLEVDDSTKSCLVHKKSIFIHVKEIVEPGPNPDPQPEPTPENPCVLVKNSCHGEPGEELNVCKTLTPLKFNKEKIGERISYDFGDYLDKTLLFKEPFCTGGTITPDENFWCIEPFLSVFIDDEQRPSDDCIWIFEQGCLSGKKTEICKNTKKIKLGSFVLGKKVRTIKFSKFGTSISHSRRLNGEVGPRVLFDFYQAEVDLTLNDS